MTDRSDTVNSHGSRQDIAIIGMGCIFPKANGLKEYWRLLFNGEDAITDIPENSHWALDDYFDSDPAAPDRTYCRRGGFLPGVSFDPLAFGIPPNNLEATDTSQLLGLTVARTALEDAGYPADDPYFTDHVVNVVLGVTGTQELVIPLGARLGHPLWKKALADAGVVPEQSKQVMERLESAYVQWQENSFPGLLGNVVAGRIANRLNLSGTNCVSDAACASSLSALHTAVMELSAGKCDMSITGGVDTLNDIFMHMCFSKTGVLSHSSDARPFSKDADGTVLGEGIGMLVLKRLADAEKDRNRIYAVIKGVGTSSDGRTAGIYTPDARGQVRALTSAYRQAGIEPCTVGLIEAHGTGTRVGDKVEFTALRQVFTCHGKIPCCAVGSVKSMIGHTKAAAGAAGLIKSALALYHKVLPPTLKAREPDPELDIAASPFYLNDTTRPWTPPESVPRRSGVSAFGFGGSNFHAVLEEYIPEKTDVSWDGTVQIAAFSSLDEQTLISQVKAFQAALCSGEPPDSLDSNERSRLVAWHTMKARRSFSSTDHCRMLFIIRPEDDIASLCMAALEAVEKNAPVLGPDIFYQPRVTGGKLGFLFPGQGSQYLFMGKDLIAMFPEGQEGIQYADRGFADVHRSAAVDPLSSYIFAMPMHIRDPKESETLLRQTEIAQPAIGAVTAVMIKILERFNIRPDVSCGHSFGELSALFAAKAVDQSAFFRLAAYRGKFMAAAGSGSEDSGSMMAVQAPLDIIDKLITDHDLDLILANRNSHDQGVLSGPTPEIERAGKICRQNRLRAVKLPVAAAFHSKFVADAAEPFQKILETVSFGSCVHPVLSNMLGGFYPEDIPGICRTLGRQIKHPVRFVENILAMRDMGVDTFVEVGPKAVLTGLTRSILKNDTPAAAAVALDAGQGKMSGIHDLAKVLCTLASRGINVDLTQWEEPAAKPDSKKMRVTLTGANVKPKPSNVWPEHGSSGVNPKRPDRGAGQKNITVQATVKENHMTPPLTQGIRPGQAPSPDTVSLIHKGFEAIQDLQAQTTRAHEKFLETQAQASRVIQQMMEQTRTFAGNRDTAQPMPPVTADVNRGEAAPVDSFPVRPGTVSVTEDPIKTGQKEPKFVSEPTVPDMEKAAAAADEAVSPGIDMAKETVFRIISKLTGFPEEMLELSMDIESDLGIDSIKKVEIMSELEKLVPDSGGQTTDKMAAMKTLEDICRSVSSLPPYRTADAAAPGLSAETPENESLATAGGTVGPQALSLLVETIAELTGFPTQMIEPSMALESDLGIDSIKRVEILSKLEQSYPQGPSLAPDDMVRLKTVQEIADYLDRKTRMDMPSDPVETNSAVEKKKAGLSAATPEKAPAAALVRRIPVIKAYPCDQIRFYNGARIDIDPGKKVYITKESAGIAKAFKKAFKKQGIAAELIDLQSGRVPVLPDAAGIVIVAPAFRTKTDAPEFLKTAFELAVKNGNHLMAAGREKGAFFTTVTFMGSMFGLDGSKIDGDPVFGGLAGLAKTARLEWQPVLCRAMDMPHDIKVCIEQAEAAVSLMMTQGAAEMGLNRDACNIPQLKTLPVPDKQPRLSKADVVVMTGGARGVTAACAVEMARQYAPTLVLLGRSAPPAAEPDWLADMHDPARIKKEILSREFGNRKIKPALLEEAFRKVMAGREIRRTLEQIQAAGSTVRYIQVDIRQPHLVSDVFEEIREEFENITVVVHGAGVLEDRLIVDKTLEQFSQVFDTKVTGLDALISATRTDSLKYFILFSSVAARTGNIGQSDYAMANEVLNKIAQKLSDDHLECHVISMNWGPWNGGMVGDGLKTQFARKGIALIDMEQGAAQLIREMGAARKACVEIVVGASLTDKGPEKEPSMSKVFEQVLKPDCPVVNAHRIDSKPVVPFALFMEWMAHAAVRNNPGLVFSGMDDVRLFKGVVLEDKPVTLWGEVSRIRPGGDGYELQTRIMSHDDGRGGLLHAGSRTILADRLPDAPKVSSGSRWDPEPYPLTVAQVYDTVLFHGDDLQKIRSITGFSDKGIEVVTDCAPPPEHWLRFPHCDRWAVDPMMLDAAFQAAILWCHAVEGSVCLPSYAANFRVYDACVNPTQTVRIRLTVNEHGINRIKGYFTFLNDSDEVIASMSGFEGIVDKGLPEKFRKPPLFDRNRILAFAEGRPSVAFGDRYRVFDQEREIARLPRPPYFFMDRVITAEPVQWKMEPGGWIESQYDIPPDEWYFKANHTYTVPFCILLEIALQPCGWLAAYAGSALHSDERLYFRNLGGDATVARLPDRQSGCLTVRSRITDVSAAGGMIIQEFDMAVWSGRDLCYQGHTSFGFFSAKALSNQVGIRNSRFGQYQLSDAEKKKSAPVIFEDLAPVTPDDRSVAPHSGMPAKALRMVDAVDEILFDCGGVHGAGYISAVKAVDPGEWFFDAHFYQDPVCPGSLGIESFLQVLRYYGMEKWHLTPREWTSGIAAGQSHQWVYRGQIAPRNKSVRLAVHIRETDEQDKRITADGSLSVDGICIYEMTGFTIQMVPHTEADEPRQESAAVTRPAGR